MNVPDPAVWASIPIVAGSLLWAAKQFVTSTVNEKGDKGEKGDTGEGLTVKGYKELSELLISRLNGRYMMASESREKFAALEGKLDTIHIQLALHLKQDIFKMESD